MLIRLHTYIPALGLTSTGLGRASQVVKNLNWHYERYWPYGSMPVWFLQMQATNRDRMYERAGNSYRRR